MWTISLKPNSYSLGQQWLRGLFALCIGVGICLPGAAFGARCGKRHLVSAAELETKLKQYKSISKLEARFEQVKTLKDAGVTLKSSGIFSLRMEHGGPAVVDWTVEKPAYLRLHITDKSIDLAEKAGEAGKPVIENREAQARILRPIYAWLTVDAAKISEQFEIDHCGHYRLTPKDKDSPIKEMYMSLNGSGLVESVTLNEKSGDHMQITFLSTKVTKLSGETSPKK